VIQGGDLPKAEVGSLKVMDGASWEPVAVGVAGFARADEGGGDFGGRKASGLLGPL
jgi:hypothetical protein